MDKPNILFLFTDQQSARAMGCAGNPHLDTPHMDRLAATGLRFTQAYCASPVCGPSRSSLVSGRLPHETGVLVNGMSPDPAIPNFGELFARAGYQTAWSGRWHLPDIGDRMRGFTVLHDPDVHLDLGSAGDGPVTDAAIEFLGQNHTEPFCLGVSLCNPHDICHWITDPQPLPDTTNLPPLPDNFAIDPQEPEFIRQCRQRRYYGQEGTYTRDWDNQQWRTYLAAYYRFTEMVDIQIGRLLNALAECGLEENTLVLFTSDHGEGMAAHQWVVKLMLYEEPMRVPFIMRWPGSIPAGAVDDHHLVSGLDVLPTLCDYAGIGAPEVTGTSLRPLIDHPAHPGRPFVVAELYPDTKDLSMQGRMVRDQRFKYIAFSRGQRPEMLFDLHADPGERRNLALDPTGRDQLGQQRARLQSWCAQSNDAFVVPGW